METLKEFDFANLVEKSDGNLALVPRFQLMGAVFVELNAQLARLRVAAGAPAPGTGPYVHHTSIATLKSIGSFVRTNAPTLVKGSAANAAAVNVISRVTASPDTRTTMEIVAVEALPLISALRTMGNKLGLPDAFVPDVPYLPYLPTTSPALSKALGTGSQPKSGNMWVLALIGVSLLVAFGADGMKPKGR